MDRNGDARSDNFRMYGCHGIGTVLAGHTAVKGSRSQLMYDAL